MPPLQGLAPEVATYNLMLATCTKLGQPKSALAVYDKCAVLHALPCAVPFKL